MNTVENLGDYILLLLAQFTGGPGPRENNLVRFGLAAILWALLWVVAWSRQRHQSLPRERLLLWGFGLGLARESFMFAHTSSHIFPMNIPVPPTHLSEPLEHGLTMGAVIVVAAAFLRYVLDERTVPRRYLQVGLAATAVMLLGSWLWWFQHIMSGQGSRFNQTFTGVFFHLMTGGFAAVAISQLAKKGGWLSRVVSLALGFFVIIGILRLLNFASGQAYDDVYCRVCNGLHILAIPILGYVYIREQTIEKEQAERALDAYSNRLEEIVKERTVRLLEINERLQVEIAEREYAQAAIARRNMELAAQNSIAATISRTLDLDTVLDTALDTAIPALGMDAGCIYLLDPDTGALVLKTVRGANISADPGEDESDPCSCFGISRQTMAGTKPLVLDAREYAASDASAFVMGEGLQTLVSTPIVTKDKIMGAVSLASRQPEAISAAQLELMAAIGQQIGMALENARLYQEAGRRAEELALLHASSTLLTGTLDATTIYHQVTEQVTKLLSCHAAAVFLWDEEEQDAIVVFAHGIDDQEARELHLTPEDSPLLRELMAGQRGIAMEKVEGDPRVPASWHQQLGMQAMLCIPLLGKDRLLGFLFFVDRQGPRTWRANEVAWAESLANQAALALEKAYLYGQVEHVAALEERQRIAAEMHDGLAQTLSYLALKADHATDLLQEGEVSAVLQEYSAIQDAIQRATREVRMSIASLRESPSPREPLHIDLARIVDEAVPGGKPPVQIVNRLERPLFLPSQQVEQVRGVVQEALVNAVRHAGAGRITLCLEGQGDWIEVSVEDDGQGFDPAAVPATGDHFGLSIMRARAARIDGHLAIDSKPGRGTRVSLGWSIPPGRRSSVAPGS